MHVSKPCAVGGRRRVDAYSTIIEEKKTATTTTWRREWCGLLALSTEKKPRGTSNSNR
jgi:hypothetical protein